jgi:putative hemolysin
LDPSTCPAPGGRPPPATAWLVVGLTPVLADIAPVDVAVRLVAIGALLAVAAALALTEAAVLGARDEPSHLADEETPTGARVSWLRRRRRPALVALLLLNALAIVSAALVALPLIRAVATGTGVGAAVVVGALIVLGCAAWLAAGVAAPRSRGKARAAAAVRLTLPLVRAVLPLASRLERGLVRVQSRPRGPVEPISAEDVRSMAGAAEEEPIGEEEAALIHSIMEFGDTTVREVMVGRMDMVALPDSATLDDALALIRDAGHSRYPLFGRDLDDIRGVVYAKDLLPLAVPDRGENGPVAWDRIARRARFVPPGRNLDDLLADFQAQRTHLAIVVDEYGGTLGLVTLEDLLEEVVGEIRDELDEPEDEPHLLEVGPDTFRADARLDLDEFFDALGMEVDTDDFGFETLGGLVFHLAGAVPAEGHEVTFEHLRLRVETLDANRIREVTIVRSERPDETEDQPAP